MSVQLELPLGEPVDPAAYRTDSSRRVFVNRDLKMGDIEWVGFDMDYTLALYHQEEMDRLSIEATVEKLVARGYPTFLREIPYPLHFPIRGLLIDKRLGNVLKMNRFKIVRKGYHGLRELSGIELRALYYEKKIRHKSSRYHWIDTLYALSEACMYAAIIDAFEQRGLSVHYRRLFDDIRECIDEAHRDGTIVDAVMADTARYVARDPSLAGTLHKLRSAGKRLFVLTNSRWPYTKKLLGYLLDDALPDYPGFQSYFDLLVVAAKKPGFFTERKPLQELRGSELVAIKLPLDRGRIYDGGNLRDLQSALGVPGDRVLYVGDHIYGDMLRSKKDSTWRTAMIIQELLEEVSATETAREDHDLFDELYQRRHQLDDQLRAYQQRFKELSRKTNGNGHANGSAEEANRVKRLIAGVRRQLRWVDDQTSGLRRRIDRRFHRYWGPLLKEANELSLFGDQVSEYACVYTARVSNLLSYSPHQYFRSPRGLMHHEL